MNNSYVFSLGTRQYGFAYDKGVSEASAIADTLTTFDVN